MSNFNQYISKTKYNLLSVKIFYLSGIYRFMILCLPKNILHSFLGTSGKESNSDEILFNKKKAYYYGIHINKICNKTPWKSQCLVKAMIAQHLLHKKSIHSTLYLGVAKDKEKGLLLAHAWIRCGDLFVTGGNGSDYVAVAKFYK